MIGCSMVEPVRNEQQAQEEVENEDLDRVIYTTGASEHQLPFRMEEWWPEISKEKQIQKEKHGLSVAGLACRYDLL
jgi:hypothetical protein